MKNRILAILVIVVLLFLTSSLQVVRSESEEKIPVAVIYTPLSGEIGCFFFYKNPASQAIYTNCKGPLDFYGVSEESYTCPKGYHFSEAGSTVSRWVRYGGDNGRVFCTLKVISYSCVEKDGKCTGGLCLEGFETKSQCEDKTQTEINSCWGCCNKDGE